MKYWNKDKDVRRRLWTKVKVPQHCMYPNSEAKRWCQQHPSEGKFYYYYGVDSWWFEHEQDATLFLLRWA